MQLGMMDMEGLFPNPCLMDLTIRNYRLFHGEVSLPLKSGVNLLMAGCPSEYEFGEELTVEEILEPRGSVQASMQFHASDLLAAVDVLRGGEYDELEDLSFFKDKDVIEVSAHVDGVWTGNYVLERRKTYRGAERSSIAGKKLSLEAYPKQLMKRHRIGIYPHDLKHLERQRILLSEAFKELVGELSEPWLNDLATFAVHAVQSGCHTAFFGSQVLYHIQDEHYMEALRMLEWMTDHRVQVVAVFHNPLDYGAEDRFISSMEWYEGWSRQKGSEPLFHLTELKEAYKGPGEWQDVTVRMAARQLLKMQCVSLDEKLEISKRIILKALRSAHGPVAIGYSGGKDSELTLSLVKEVCETHGLEKPAICFIDTRIEFLEHTDYVAMRFEELKEEGYPVYWEKTPHNFWNIVKKDGFPLFSKAIREKTNPELFKMIQELNIPYAGNKCCELMKKVPYKALYSRLGTELVFSGLTAAESDERRKSYYRGFKRNYLFGTECQGYHYYVKGEGLWKCTPIIHFYEDDVLEATRLRALPMSPIYSMGYTDEDGEFIHYKRNGCRFCAFGIHMDAKDNNLTLLRHTHPKDYELLMFKKGLAKVLYRIKHKYTEEQWQKDPGYFDGLMAHTLNARPCHLDTLF